MKKIISLLMAFAILFALVGCSGKNTASDASNTNNTQSIGKLDIDCNVYGLNGPTGMGLAPLMEKAEKKEGRLNYTISNVAANEEIVAKITNGEANIAAVATNLASTLYKKTNGNIKVLAVNTLGVLTLVTKGEEITDIKDLKGKTIYATGQGANPEYIINDILEKNGLKVGTDVTVNYVSQPAELVTTVASNEKAIVVAPQPVATTITVKDSAAKIALDMNDEWDKISDTKLVMGCIIARKDYVEQNPDAIKAFLADYKESIDTVNSDTENAAALCEKYGIVPAAAIAKKALPYCNIVFEDGKELKTDLSAYLDFLYKANPASIGGAIPEDDFYYDAD